MFLIPIRAFKSTPTSRGSGNGILLSFRNRARSSASTLQCPEVPTRYPLISPFSSHRLTLSLVWLQIGAISDVVNVILFIFVLFCFSILLPIVAQGLPAVRRAGLPAVRRAGLPASGGLVRRLSGGLIRRPSGGFIRRFCGGMAD